MLALTAMQRPPAQRLQQPQRSHQWSRTSVSYTKHSVTAQGEAQGCGYRRWSGGHETTLASSEVGP